MIENHLWIGGYFYPTAHQIKIEIVVVVGIEKEGFGVLGAFDLFKNLLR